MATGAVIEEVAQNLEEAAEVTRKLNAQGIGLFVGGIAIGAAVGFYFGHRWNKEKLRAEAFKQSEEEVEKIRTAYQASVEAVKLVKEKPDLEDVVEDRGYSVKVEVPERPTRPPVPVLEPAATQEPVTYPRRDYSKPGVAKRTAEREKDKNEGWDYELEIANRSPLEPYIIHQDEFTQNEPEYNQVTYTYYAVDSILTDEEEEKIADEDPTVGLKNLGNFGHGTDDFHVLYVRNERLEMDFEICLLPASYKETVQGLSNDGES